MYTVKYIFECDYCDNIFEHPFSSDNRQNPIANLPSGWSEIPQGYVCDKHIITITDKEEISE